jgi:hypothetical protein
MTDSKIQKDSIFIKLLKKHTNIDESFMTHFLRSLKLEVS